jgi:hypothetical protein
VVGAQPEDALQAEGVVRCGREAHATVFGCFAEMMCFLVTSFGGHAGLTHWHFLDCPTALAALLTLCGL